MVETPPAGGGPRAASRGFLGASVLYPLAHPVAGRSLWVLLRILYPPPCDVYCFSRMAGGWAVVEPTAIHCAIHTAIHPGGLTPTLIQLYLLGQGVSAEPPPHRRRPCDEAVCSLEGWVLSPADAAPAVLLRFCLSLARLISALGPSKEAIKCGEDYPIH